jgi:hypothetical protein
MLPDLLDKFITVRKLKQFWLISKTMAHGLTL